MICYSCPQTLGPRPFHDKETGRYYCETCREIIWGLIMEHEEPKKPVIEDGEVELLEDDFDDTLPDDLGFEDDGIDDSHEDDFE